MRSQPALLWSKDYIVFFFLDPLFKWTAAVVQRSDGWIFMVCVFKSSKRHCKFTQEHGMILWVILWDHRSLASRMEHESLWGKTCLFMYEKTLKTLFRTGTENNKQADVCARCCRQLVWMSRHAANEAWRSKWIVKEEMLLAAGGTTSLPENVPIWETLL